MEHLILNKTIAYIYVIFTGVIIFLIIGFLIYSDFLNNYNQQSEAYTTSSIGIMDYRVARWFDPELGVVCYELNNNHTRTISCIPVSQLLDEGRKKVMSEYLSKDGLDGCLNNREELKWQHQIPSQ